VNKPLHLYTNPEILVKINPLDSELPGLESRPLKNKKKLIKNFGKFAEQAKNRQWIITDKAGVFKSHLASAVLYLCFNDHFQAKSGSASFLPHCVPKRNIIRDQ